MIAKIFPPHIVNALVKASQVEANPLNRVARYRAIEQAIQKAKRECPDLFQPERKID